MTAAIQMGLKRNALFLYLTQIPKAKHLKAARISQNRLIPLHKRMQATMCLNHFQPWPQPQMKGIAQHNMCTNRLDIPWQHAFDRAIGAHRHEDGGLHHAMVQGQLAAACVAVWVGFLALFGIASDDGVVMATYLEQSFRENKHNTVAQLREATVAAGQRRIRACLMTTATTILALLPILTSTGRGSDVMVPMAIPSFGGMLVVLISIFVVPILYCWVEELKLTQAS